MTVNRTTLLDLPLPVTGTESGTWGDTTNNGLTQYMDIAIAGMSNLTSANFTIGALTIETTEGNSTGTNISATSAQYAGFRVTSLTQNSTITVGNTGTSPARSYRLINADATYTLTFKATGQTGITLQPGQTAVVAFNGTDYVIVGMAGAGTATDNAVVRFDGTTGKLVQNSVVTIADTTGDVAGVGALTASGNLTLSGGTANGVLYLNGSKVATSGSALTFDGTNFATTGTATATKLIPTGNVTAGNGMYLPTTNELAWSVNGSEGMRLTSTGLGIGTSSPQTRLEANQTGVGSVVIPIVAANQDTSATGTGAGIGFVVDGVNDVIGAQVAGIRTGSAYHQSAMAFYTRDSGGSGLLERMRLDTSGNLGLGVTPSAWSSGFKAFQFGNIGAVSWNGAADIYLSNNYANIGGTSKYIISAAAALYSQASGTHAWYTAPSGTAGNAITFSQVMTLDASGNLGIGTTSPGAKLHVDAGSNNEAVRLNASSTFNTAINWYNAGSIKWSTQTLGDGSNAYRWYNFTTNSEAMRITSGGYFKASDNGSYTGSTGSYHELQNSTNNTGTIIRSTNASMTNDACFVAADRNTTNNTFYAISYYNYGATAYKFRVADSGDVTNTNNSYAGISDLKLKQDIVDASSQWDDIKNLRVRKYRLKADPAMPLHIGLVAQEVELVSPGLVDEHTDRDAKNNDLGTKTKSVKYSILYMKAIKALQEAMARIETLEAKVVQLEGA